MKKRIIRPVWAIWKESAGKHTRWRFIDPRTRKRRAFASRSQAEKERTEAHRLAQTGSVQLAGPAQARWLGFSSLCDEFSVPPEEALGILRQQLALRRAAPPVSVAEAVKECLATLQRQGKSQFYLGPLATRLNRFARQFPMTLPEVPAGAVRQWLEGLEAGPRTVNHYAAAVARLFSFARDRAWLPKEHALALDKMELPDREPSTFTPAELRLVLEHVGPTALPSVLLSAFAGLRPVETLRICWEDVDWEDGSLMVPRAKKKDRRLAPILPNLRAWLEPLKGEGRIVPLSVSGLTVATQRAVQRANEKLELFGAKQRLVWSPDVLRHSFGSYRWAVVRSIAQVVEEMGNSARTFKQHYRQLKPRSQGAAWFEIMPDGMRGNVLQLDFPRFSTPHQRHTTR